MTSSVQPPAPAAPDIVWSPEPDPKGFLQAMVIPIVRNGEVIASAIVDADVYPALARWQWTLSEGGYVVRSRTFPGGVGSEKLRMHRVIMCCTPRDGLEIDHINRVPLDNRRVNLRFVTNAENLANRKAPKANFVRLDNACKNGHTRTAENTSVLKGGRRRCLECDRIRDRKRDQIRPHSRKRSRKVAS